MAIMKDERLPFIPQNPQVLKKGLTLTILSEPGPREGGKSFAYAEVELDGVPSLLSLNKSCWRNLVKTFKSQDSKDWVGKEIVCLGVVPTPPTEGIIWSAKE